MKENKYRQQSSFKLTVTNLTEDFISASFMGLGITDHLGQQLEFFAIISPDHFWQDKKVCGPLTMIVTLMFDDLLAAGNKDFCK